MKHHNTNNFDATIVADSINQGNRITSILVTYPRIVHAEMCRHRMHSRNTASSRAIPFDKMVERVQSNPFIPIAWQKDHSGMQGTEYIEDDIICDQLNQVWLEARDMAVKEANLLSPNKNKIGVTKQLCNRLLEPFVWVTELITATEWENFFNLRCPQYEFEGDEFHAIYRSKKDAMKDGHEAYDEHPKGGSELDWLELNTSQAEIHVQKIAELMWDAMNESTPQKLQSGEWHIPFGDNIEESKLSLLHYGNIESTTNIEALYNDSKIKIATARCARTSYINYEGTDDYKKDINLHDRLLKYNHMSPFEHCAKAMSHEEYREFIRGRVDSEDSYDEFEVGEVVDYNSQVFPQSHHGWCRNFKGYIQYRHLIESNYE